MIFNHGHGDFMAKGTRVGNLEISKDNVMVYVNPKIYPLDVVYSASYVFLDRAYVLIGGDPEKEIVVELRSKKGKDSEVLGRGFNNELLNYAVYRMQSSKAEPIRKAIVDAAMSQGSACPADDEDCLDDPLGISVPWEETNGGKDD